jgi:hypothetical protein
MPGSVVYHQQSLYGGEAVQGNTFNANGKLTGIRDSAGSILCSKQQTKPLGIPVLCYVYHTN